MPGLGGCHRRHGFNISIFAAVDRVETFEKCACSTNTRAGACLGIPGPIGHREHLEVMTNYLAYLLNLISVVSRRLDTQLKARFGRSISWRTNLALYHG